MKIKKIELCNIGSYEGVNILDVSDADKNIILVGGRNGTGKTTLFESIKLCFYGNKVTGYQFSTVAYNKKVMRLVNNVAKLNGNAKVYVAVTVEIFNGQENDTYVLKREWNLSKKDSESFSVNKNGILLKEDEFEAFCNYILDVIPPELFNLYFFDGEKFEDAFLNSRGNEKIKKAFLTLCGYDTFDIMLQNFRRIGYNKKTTKISSVAYLESKAKLAELKAKETVIQEKLAKTYSELEKLSGIQQELEATYRKSGGVTIQEWNEKLNQVKKEEARREFLNSQIKEFANDVIPFLMVRKQLEAVFMQIEKEENFNKQKNLYEEVKKLFSKVSKKTIKDTAATNEDVIEFTKAFYKELESELSLDGLTVEDINPILRLSYSEQQIITKSIVDIFRFNKNEVINNRNALKESIAKTRTLREILDNCNIDNVQKFLQKKEQLNEEKQALLNKLPELLSQKSAIEIEVKNQELVHKHNLKALEEELKNNSIVDLSSKAILFLEKLQDELSKQHKQKLEELFSKKLNELMRKENFFDKVEIDADFNINIYRDVSECGEMQEIDKEGMSMGEKQIFVMALYWSLMQLTNKRVPFVMDTPLARIDAAHRERIVRHFFNELDGQVFIFSTDKEIVWEDIELLKPKLGKTFLLENDGASSTIKEKEYFSEM